MAEVVVPKGSIAGSPEYIASTLSNARNYAQFVERDARPLARFCRELRACKAWETWLPDEPKTWERFCKEGLGYDADFLTEIEEGVAVLESQGTTGPIPAVEARAAVAKPLAEHGEIGRGRESRDYNIISTQQGTSADYLTARIARDRPDILERMKQGEYKSVRAAARDAGIVKPTFAAPIDVQAAARAIRRHFTDEQIEQLVRLLTTGELS